jgi:hypothetical protein
MDIEYIMYTYITGKDSQAEEQSGVSGEGER